MPVVTGVQVAGWIHMKLLVETNTDLVELHRPFPLYSLVQVWRTPTGHVLYNWLTSETNTTFSIGHVDPISDSLLLSMKKVMAAIYEQQNPENTFQ